jgi:hypothetical protein
MWLQHISAYMERVKMEIRKYKMKRFHVSTETSLCNSNLSFAVMHCGWGKRIKVFCSAHAEPTKGCSSFSSFIKWRDLIGQSTRFFFLPDVCNAASVLFIRCLLCSSLCQQRAGLCGVAQKQKTLVTPSGRWPWCLLVRVNLLETWIHSQWGWCLRWAHFTTVNDSRLLDTLTILQLPECLYKSLKDGLGIMTEWGIWRKILVLKEIFIV